MNFISICSGIEAASVAFGPLGWKAIAFSEIEPFPCAVLAHHYPEVPNFGDMSKFREWPEEIFADADAIVGGPPCQAFSVAGLRNGLNDDRGNLTLTYAELIDHADAIRLRAGKPPVIVLYENVPGLLSDKTGAFGCFLGALAGEDDPLEPPGGKWTNAGYVLGPQRAVAWRVLDAQYFGVAQRRRRVFVVASARAGFDPAAVLFEFEGMRRDSPPSREAGEGTAGGFARSVALRGREGGATAELGDDLQNCLRASSGGGDKPHVITMAHGQGGAEIGFDRGPTLTCNHEAPIAAYALQGNMIGRHDAAGPQGTGVSAELCFTQTKMDVHAVCVTGQVTHTLKAEGFDASEDGTGRGQPIVTAFEPRYYLRDNKTGGAPSDVASLSATNAERAGDAAPHVAVAFQVGNLKRGAGASPSEEVFPTLKADHGRGLSDQAPCIAFSCKDHGGDAGPISPTLRSMGHDGSHANAGGQVAVAFAENSRAEVRLEGGDGQRTGAISTGGGKPGQGVPMVAVSVSLRGREGGATAELGDEVANCLRASGGGGDKEHVFVPVSDTLYNKGIVTLKEGNASTQETDPGTLLRTLRQEVGEEAFAKWGLGILDSLQQAEVLRQALHGLSIRPAPFSRSWVVYCALSRSKTRSAWLLQSLREAGCERCASQGWEPSEQLAGELGAYLSELSRPGAQAARFLHDLWQASQGFGVLRQALSAVQEVGRPAHGQRKPVHAGAEGFGAAGAEGLQGAGLHREIPRDGVLQQACAASEAWDSGCSATEQERGGQSRLGQTPFAVRRLTCEEAEFLQGFPKGYTKIPWRKKPASDCPDGPRYRALGNSWAVPNVRWIGRRIDAQLRACAGSISKPLVTEEA